jgi:hypothetical protein
VRERLSPKLTPEYRWEILSERHEQVPAHRVLEMHRGRRKAVYSRTPRDDEEVQIDFIGDDDRACCGPGSVPAVEWKDQRLPGGDGSRIIARLDY